MLVLNGQTHHFLPGFFSAGSYITLASEVTSELHGLKHLTCFSRDLHQTEWNLSITARIGETEDL